MPLLALFLGTFCLGTAEFLATGILPLVAGDLGIGVPAASSMVTCYALGVAFGGPVLGLLLGRLPRKPVLIGLLLAFAAAQVATALAPNLELLLTARVLGAACQGAFFGTASIVAISAAGEGKSGTALSLMVAGITVANVLGLPGGTALGHALGWRMSFAVLAAIAFAVTILIATFVPSTRSDGVARAPLLQQAKALLHRDVLLSYAVMTLASIGFFSVFTFIAPLLTTVTNLTTDTIAVLLVGFGVGSTAGALAGGKFADWRPMTSIISILLAEMAIFATIVVAADQPVAMAIAVMALGFCAFAYAPGLFVQLFRAASDAPDLASTLISTAFNLGIASGSSLGALLLSSGGTYPQLGFVGLLSGSIALAAATAMLSRRRLFNALASPA
jgi:DHA1 family inner membrane transport protein